MIQDGITFNNVKTNGVNMDQWPIIFSGDSQEPDIDGGIINAVSIDWNEANLQAKLNSMQSVEEGLQHNTIKSTGELIDEIVHLRAEVNTLTSLVKGLYAALSV